ncbi:MAG: 3-oxoacid CoA-transferase subunit B [Desulfobacterales bacterium]
MSGLVPKEHVKTRIARRIAQEFMAQNRRMFINLGVGTPTLVANYIHGGRIFLQAENGMLGVGPKAVGETIDPKLINAGREPVTETRGCCYFDSATSFGMIRGGHIDATVIGAFEVDETGSIANWIIPNGRQLGVGGAMDLVAGARQVVVALPHTSSDGKPKLVQECTLPVTGYHEADLVVTELAVFRFRERRMLLTEIAPEIDLEGLKAVTRARFDVDPGLRPMPV